MTRKAFIAIPTYSGEINYLTMVTVTRAIGEMREQGWDADIAVRPTDSLLCRARNVLIAAFLKSDATDLVFWDADVAAEPGDFVRLMSHEADLVGGAYPSKCEPERWIVRPFPDRCETDPASGLIEVDGLATGFLRISRSAVERMIAAYPDLWATDPSAPGTRIPWLFDMQLIEHIYCSEDYVFCRRWQAIGGKAWLDPWLRLHHTGVKTFSGCFGDSLHRKPLATLEAARQALAEAAASMPADGGIRMLAAE